MRNVIQMSLKWLFFPKNRKTPAAVIFALRSPSLISLVAPVCSAGCLIETFFEQKTLALCLSSPPPIFSKMLVARVFVAVQYQF